MSTNENKRIVVIDDDADTRAMIELLLQGEGYEVQSAGDWQTGLAMIDLDPPDAIILDVMMPDMNGAQVVAALKKKPHTAVVPIVMVTALSAKKYRKTALWDLGVDYYVTKPFDPEDLTDKVREAVKYKKFES